MLRVDSSGCLAQSVLAVVPTSGVKGIDWVGARVRQSLPWGTAPAVAQCSSAPTSIVSEEDVSLHGHSQRYIYIYIYIYIYMYMYVYIYIYMRGRRRAPEPAST